MILWMLQSMLVAALMCGAALAAETALGLLGRPRRWAWPAAMSASVALPIGAGLLPASSSPPPSSGLPVDVALLDELARMGGARVPPSSWLVGVIEGPVASSGAIWLWAIGSLVLLALLVATYSRLRSAGRGPLVEIEGVPARVTSGSGPMVVGLRRPVVVVPRWVEALAAEERRLILRHEWEHARAGDTRLLAGSALLVALLPWNLPLWWMQRRLRQAVEVDCDARVLASGADRRAYGSMLIRTAGRPAAFPHLAPALVRLPSLLERRILAMTARTPGRSALRLVPLLSAGAMLFAAACELTPRGSALSPTEPSLADILEPSDSAISERVVIRLRQGGDTIPGDSLRFRVLRSPEGEVSVRRTGPDGETVLVPAQPIRLGSLSTGKEKPLFYVDGQRVDGIDAVPAERIAVVEVLKGPEAVARFGPEGKGGVIQVTTKEHGAAGDATATPGARMLVRGARPTGEGTGSGEARVRVRGTLTGADGRVASPFILVDGNRVASMEAVAPDAIAQIEVIKGQAALERFGADGKEGVVLITTKK